MILGFQSGDYFGIPTFKLGKVPDSHVRSLSEGDGLWSSLISVMGQSHMVWSLAVDMVSLSPVCK